MAKEVVLEPFISFLRQSGHKVTRVRRQVAKEALCMDGHFEAADLWERLRQTRVSKVSVSTVYRTLDLLVQAELLQVTDLGDPHAHYEVARGKGHEHILCIKCGQVTEVVDPELEAAIDRLARGHGFRLEGHSLRVYGICSRCQKKRGMDGDHRTA